MKTNRSAELLEYLLSKSNTWVGAEELSAHLGVGARQIRNYITSINEQCDSLLLIESSNKGYCLDSDNYVIYRQKIDPLKAETKDTRQNYIIQKLVVSIDGYDIFDFSDELFVSLPTIENDLKHVRRAIDKYGLKIRRSKNIVYLDGSEKSKRNLMNDLISSDSYDNFVLKDEVRLLTFHYHFWDFRANIHRILVEHDFFSNDYTLNDIALHLIIMIDRIRNGCILKETVSLDSFSQQAQYNVARSIADYVESTYDITMETAELYSLTLTISNNTTMTNYTFLNAENMNEYIEQKYIDIASNVMHRVEKCYYLDPFDNDFFTRFTMHVKNLFNRLENNYYAKNPLTSKIKATYPLIYDIAVFIAQEFKNDYNIHLNEDEIAFIAFHIGGYFENNVQNKNKISCTFVYANYYSNYKSILDKIARVFSDQLQIKLSVSLNQYRPENIVTDLIISMVDMPFPVESIIINPFLTDADMQIIRTSIEGLMNRHKKSALKAYLLNFVNPEMFYKNLVYSDKSEVIEILTKDAIRLDYAKESLTEDVLAREAMSDTAFCDVAVPHSLSRNAKKSFISFAISETLMQWGDKQVYLIALIGISEDSRKIFSQVFDYLIDILSESINIKTLVSAADYDDFIKRLIDLIEKNSNIN